MVRTEPFTAEDVAREIIESVSKMEGYDVEEKEENNIVIKNATIHSINGTIDHLYDVASA